MINIKSDSRKIKKGDIFVALRGISSDGHDYIDKAIELGASEIVVEEVNKDYNVKTTVVSDTREYLNKYLYDNYHDVIDNMTLIGITGTNGKTTSCFFTYEALNKLGYKCGYIGTIGFYLDEKVRDLPNTNPDICDMYDMIVESYDKGFRYVVLEASSQGIAYGRIETLKFDYAVFTNLTRDHLDYHKTMENYALAKQQLFNQLKDNGLGIVNCDDSYCSYYEIGNYVTYGFNGGNYKVTNYEINAQGTTFTINDKYTLSSKLIGKYNIYNMVVTYILLDKIGIPYEKVKDIFLKLDPPSGRMDMIKYNTNTIVIDYAHTPDAMENIINTIKEIKHNHLYIVFGCTGCRDRVKRPIMTSLALSSADFTYITSDDLHEESFEQIIDDMLKDNTKNNYMVIEDRYSAVKKAISNLDSKDILLILGKGHEEYIVIGNKKIPYNDRKAVLEIIESKEFISN